MHVPPHQLQFCQLFNVCMRVPVHVNMRYTVCKEERGLLLGDDALLLCEFQGD